MKNYKNLLVLALFSVGIKANLNAQLNLAAQNLPNTWQTNTATWTPNGTNWQIFAPSVGVGFDSDFALSDLVSGGVVRVDDAFIQGLDNINNRVVIQQNFQLFGIGKKINDHWSWNASQTSKSRFRLNFNKDLAQLLAKGNRPFVGKWLDLDLDFSEYTYSEWATGVSWTGDLGNKKWTFGGRAKLLMGVQAAHTSLGQSRLLTDSLDYALNFENNFAIQTVGVETLNDLSPRGGTRLPQAGLVSGNTGFGVDFGAAVSFGKWQLSANMMDFRSYINWKSDKTYKSKGNFTYRPRQVDSLGAIRTALDFGRVRDSFETILGIKTTENEGFVTFIPARLYLNAGYDLNEKLKLTAQVAYTGSLSAGLGAQYDVKPNFMVGLQGNYLNGRRVGLGVQSVLTLQNLVQIYVATDDLIQVFQLDNATATSAQLGINFLFGGQKNKK